MTRTGTRKRVEGKLERMMDAGMETSCLTKKKKRGGRLEYEQISKKVKWRDHHVVAWR